MFMWIQSGRDEFTLRTHIQVLTMVIIPHSCGTCASTCLCLSCNNVILWLRKTLLIGTQKYNFNTYIEAKCKTEYITQKKEVMFQKAFSTMKM